MSVLKWMIPVVAITLPVAAFAQSSDAQYCSALTDKYTQLLDMDQKHASQPQSLEARVAIEKCKAGDTAAGIPPLEKALRNARIDLPPHA